MSVYSVLGANFFIRLIEIIWFICAAALVFIILIQKGKGGGLSGIFGSSMAGSLLGADTKKPMTWFTIGLVTVFLLLAILLAKYDRPERTLPGESSGAGTSTSAPAESGTPGDEPSLQPEEGGQADDLTETILNEVNSL